MTKLAPALSLATQSLATLGLATLGLATLSLATLCLGAAPAVSAEMTVTSPDFQAGGTIPTKFVFGRCGGQNRSPALSWQGAPAATRSFALTVFDPDAGHGRGWWHWGMFDIPAQAHALPQSAGSSEGAALPDGAVQGVTSSGDQHYDGPCPPVGDPPHHYVVTVYALRLPKLNLGPHPADAEVDRAAQEAALAKGTIVGRFGRN